MWVSVKYKDETLKINTDYIVMFRPESKTIVLTTGTALPLSEDDYKAVDAKMFATRKKAAKDDTELHDFLNQLHVLLGNKGSIALTGDRRKGIEKLLKEGFSKEEITIAATNIGNSEWMRGKNDRSVNYAKIDYLFRKSDGTTWNINKWQEAKEKKTNKLF